MVWKSDKPWNAAHLSFLSTLESRVITAKNETWYFSHISYATLIMRRLPCNKIYFQLKDELPHLGNSISSWWRKQLLHKCYNTHTKLCILQLWEHKGIKLYFCPALTAHSLTGCSRCLRLEWKRGAGGEKECEYYTDDSTHTCWSFEGSPNTFCCSGWDDRFC